MTINANHPCMYGRHKEIEYYNDDEKKLQYLCLNNAEKKLAICRCFHDANCQYNEQHTLEKLKEFILSRAYKVEPIELIGFFLSQAGIEFLIENYKTIKNLL